MIQIRGQNTSRFNWISPRDTRIMKILFFGRASDDAMNQYILSFSLLRNAEVLIENFYCETDLDVSPNDKLIDFKFELKKGDVINGLVKSLQNAMPETLTLQSSSFVINFIEEND